MKIKRSNPNRPDLQNPKPRAVLLLRGRRHRCRESLGARCQNIRRRHQEGGGTEGSDQRGTLQVVRTTVRTTTTSRQRASTVPAYGVHHLPKAVRVVQMLPMEEEEEEKEEEEKVVASDQRPGPRGVIPTENLNQRRGAQSPRSAPQDVHTASAAIVAAVAATGLPRHGL
jgi:hypothetical protein